MVFLFFWFIRVLRPLVPAIISDGAEVHITGGPSNGQDYILYFSELTQSVVQWSDEWVAIFTALNKSYVPHM